MSALQALEWKATISRLDIQVGWWVGWKYPNAQCDCKIGKDSIVFSVLVFCFCKVSIKFNEKNFSSQKHSAIYLRSISWLCDNDLQARRRHL